MRTITFGEKEYRVEYDINAGCDMEDKGGRAFGMIANDALVRQDLRAHRLLLWGGLRKHYPDLTLEEAGELLYMHDDRVALLDALYEEMKTAGFFGKAAQEPPKRTRKASVKSTKT